MARRKTSKQRREQRKRAKMREKESIWQLGSPTTAVYVQDKVDSTSFIRDLDLGAMLTFTTSQPVTISNCTFVGSGPQNKKEKNMYNNLSPEKEYLTHRTKKVRGEKSFELPKLYGVRDDDAPSTPEEFVKRIQTGMFILRDNKDCEFYDSYDFGSHVSWRDPAKKADKEGLEKAEKLLRADYEDTMDQIMVKDAETGLKALQDFESKTYH